MRSMPDLFRTDWVKSTYSDGEGGNCVEWAPKAATGGAVPVRDSKNPHHPALLFPTPAWTTFVSALQQGELGTR